MSVIIYASQLLEYLLLLRTRTNKVVSCFIGALQNTALVTNNMLYSS